MEMRLVKKKWNAAKKFPKILKINYGMFYILTKFYDKNDSISYLKKGWGGFFTVI